MSFRLGALDHPVDGEEIFLARRNPFSVGLEKFLQRYSETGSNSRCRLHRIGIELVGGLVRLKSDFRGRRL
jgi:hypothetical protein